MMPHRHRWCMCAMHEAALAELAAAFYGYPAKKLKMIGITGTKGKTTTAFFIAAMLREAGYHPGLIGTVWIDDGREIIPAEHTTPEASDIQRYLSRMLKNGCDVCVMEVSSQGLKMQRVEQIWYDIGVFLNIEPDHIGKGEHASFSEYLHCKRKLMMQCDIGIVNADDVNVRRILFGHTCRVETFSMNYPADFMASEKEYYIDSGQLYSSFTIDDTWNIDREFADGVQMASCRVWERARRGNFVQHSASRKV